MSQSNGSENVVWDLSVFYADPADPALQRDLAEAQAAAERFAERYRGRVASLSAAELAEALRELEAIYEKMGGLSAYALLHWTTNTADPRAARCCSASTRRMPHSIRLCSSSRSNGRS